MARYGIPFSFATKSARFTASRRCCYGHPALDAAIALLDGSDLVRPMVVEMIGTPGADGYYRKYAAFRVGDTIYGQHCAMSKSWFVKNSPERLLPAHIEEIRTYRCRQS